MRHNKDGLSLLYNIWGLQWKDFEAGIDSLVEACNLLEISAFSMSDVMWSAGAHQEPLARVFVYWSYQLAKLPQSILASL